MKDTLEEYFNVNDTLDTLKGGDNDTLETEKKVAVAVAKTAENATASTTPVIERQVEEENTKRQPEQVSNSGFSSNGNNENENNNESEFNEVSSTEITEIMKELESENRVIQTHLYFRFFELYNIDRLSKLSSKIKTHYGINSLNVSGDQNNTKMKLSNSFMDTIYFCFLSTSANRKFWNVLFDGKEYSKFLDDRFNNTKYKFEVDFEDLDKKLYEILFNVKNDREENSYELMLEFIYTVKKNLKSQGNISIEDFFNHLKIESVYFDRLIKNKLKLFELRIREQSGKGLKGANTTEIQFRTYIEKTLPDDISDKSVQLLFNKRVIGEFNLGQDRDKFFEGLDDIIKRETGVELNELKERRNNRGNFFKYNLEFIEKYFIDYFDGFSLHNEKIYKYAVVEDFDEDSSEISSEEKTNSGLGISEGEKTNKRKKKKGKKRKLAPFIDGSDGEGGEGSEEKVRRQWLLKLLAIAKLGNDKGLISKILGMLGKLKKGKTKGKKFGSSEAVEQVELTVEQQSLYDLLKKYINDKLEFSLEQVLKLYYDIYILNDELKGLKRFSKLEDLKSQVVGLESRIRLAYPEHRHNPEQIRQFVDSFVTSSKKDKYKITSEFHTLTFLICILLNVKINKDGVDGVYNWGLGIVKTEGLNDYSATDMSSVFKLCEVLYALIQELRKANNDEQFLNYFYSSSRDDNYNGWFRYEELKKFLKNCVEGKTILYCLVSQSAFITETNKLSANLAVYVALAVIHSKKSQSLLGIPKPEKPPPLPLPKQTTMDKESLKLSSSEQTIEELGEKNEIIESVFSIYNRLYDETSKTKQSGGSHNELNLKEDGNYYKVNSSSIYPPFFFTGNSKFSDVSSSKGKDIDKNCFGPSQKGIFSKLFNEDQSRAPILRDKYMTVDEEICYPTLMTDPYEGKYHKFYWGFNSNQFGERKISTKEDFTKFYKLNLNDIKFAINQDNSAAEIYLSLEGETDTIEKYKGIYTKKKDGTFKTIGKYGLNFLKYTALPIVGQAKAVTDASDLYYRKKREKQEKYVEERTREASIPTSRYYAYMRRLCNLYFQQTMFDEMITIEQSMKHLVQYYQLRQSYLVIKSVTKLPSQTSAPVTPSVTISRSVPVSPSEPVTQGEFRSRSNTMNTTAANMTTKYAQPASVVSEGSATPTILSGTASAPSLSIAPN